MNKLEKEILKQIEKARIEFMESNIAAGLGRPLPPPPPPSITSHNNEDLKELLRLATNSPTPPPPRWPGVGRKRRKELETEYYKKLLKEAIEKQPTEIVTKLRGT